MILFENFVATLIHSKIQFGDIPDTRRCRSSSSWCRASPGRRCRHPASPGHSHPPSPRELRCLPVSALALDLNFLLVINPKYGIFVLYLVNTMWCPPKPGNTINMISHTEFLKIKEKQKAFGMNNGLRVHEVFLQSQYFSLNFSFSARLLWQGCDGLHSGHVGKLAVGFEVNLKMFLYSSQSFFFRHFSGNWSSVLGSDCLHYGQMKET